MSKNNNEVSISASGNSSLEEILEKIAIGELEIRGRGYYNRTNKIFGIMLFVKDSPSETIDIFLEADNSNNKLDM